nr:MAG TPA: hypothetical protein [Bacteriophage sp.]
MDYIPNLQELVLHQTYHIQYVQIYLSIILPI